MGSARSSRSARLWRSCMRCKQLPVLTDMVSDRVHSRALTALVRARSLTTILHSIVIPDRDPQIFVAMVLSVIRTIIVPLFLFARLEGPPAPPARLVVQARAQSFGAGRVETGVALSPAPRVDLFSEIGDPVAGYRVAAVFAREDVASDDVELRGSWAARACPTTRPRPGGAAPHARYPESSNAPASPQACGPPPMRPAESRTTRSCAFPGRWARVVIFATPLLTLALRRRIPPHALTAPVVTGAISRTSSDGTASFNRLIVAAAVPGR